MKKMKKLKLLEEMLDARKHMLLANDNLFKALEYAKGDRGSQDLIYGVIKANQLAIEKLRNQFEEIEATATEK